MEQQDQRLGKLTNRYIGMLDAFDKLNEAEREFQAYLVDVQKKPKVERDRMTGGMSIKEIQSILDAIRSIDVLNAFEDMKKFRDELYKRLGMLE